MRAKASGYSATVLAIVSKTHTQYGARDETRARAESNRGGRKGVVGGLSLPVMLKIKPAEPLFERAVLYGAAMHAVHRFQCIAAEVFCSNATGF